MIRPRAALASRFGVLLAALFLSTATCCETLADSTVLSESEAKSATTGTVEKLLAEGRRHQEAGQVEAAIEKYKVALALAQSTQDADKIASLHFLLNRTTLNGKCFTPKISRRVSLRKSLGVKRWLTAFA